jgi:hypothetical protein
MSAKTKEIINEIAPSLDKIVSVILLDYTVEQIYLKLGPLIDSITSPAYRHLISNDNRYQKIIMAKKLFEDLDISPNRIAQEDKPDIIKTELIRKYLQMDNKRYNELAVIFFSQSTYMNDSLSFQAIFKLFRTILDYFNLKYIKEKTRDDYIKVLWNNKRKSFYYLWTKDRIVIPISRPVFNFI